MAKKKKPIPPEKVEGWFGILNHMGHFWSRHTFETRDEAERYLQNFARANPALGLEKHKIIPVKITIEAVN